MMIDRVRERFELWPERLIADMAYGSGEMPGWLVEERGIEPYFPVIDKSTRTDGTFSREYFAYDHKNDACICPAGKESRQELAPVPGYPMRAKGHQDHKIRRAQGAMLPERRPAPGLAIGIRRSLADGPRHAKTDEYALSRRLRKKVEMPFAQLKRILGLGRLRLRGPCGANDEFLLVGIARNLRKLAKLLPMSKAPSPA